MRKVTRVFALRQVEVEFPKLRKGDIFCMEVEDGGKTETTEWALALENAQEDKNDHREIFVPSDKIYFVVGRPEVSKLCVRKDHIVKDDDIPNVRTLQ